MPNKNLRLLFLKHTIVCRTKHCFFSDFFFFFIVQIGTADTVQVWDIERRTLLMQGEQRYFFRFQQILIFFYCSVA